MTPADHYAKAERLLEDLGGRLAEMAASGPVLAADLALVSATIQAAQVHATLATVSHETFRRSQRHRRGTR